MGLPRIFYNGGQIDLPKSCSRWQAGPAPARTVSISISGKPETIVWPRVDIPVSGEFPIHEDEDLRAKLWNWWTWATKGEPWAIALESDKTVSTTITFGSPSVPLVPGATEIQLVSSSGVAIDRYYKLISGPNFELVKVIAINGNSIDIETPLQFAYGNGAIFRDQNFFHAVLREPGTSFPVSDTTRGGDDDNVQTLPQSQFTLVLEFFEALENLDLS